jgi:hypothetical protein
VKTLLFLLNELIWIKGEDKVPVVNSFGSLKGIVSKRVKVGWIISTQYSVLTYGFISREFVLDDVSSAPFECLRQKSVRRRKIMSIASNQGQTIEPQSQYKQMVCILSPCKWFYLISHKWV